jgi:hypothetical protein
VACGSDGEGELRFEGDKQRICSHKVGIDLSFAVIKYAKSPTSGSFCFHDVGTNLTVNHKD